MSRARLVIFLIPLLILFNSKLLHELSKFRILGLKLLEGALTNDLPLVHVDDEVGVGEEVQVVGDKDDELVLQQTLDGMLKDVPKSSSHKYQLNVDDTVNDSQ